jgi:hypothetical protein
VCFPLYQRLSNLISIPIPSLPKITHALRNATELFVSFSRSEYRKCRKCIQKHVYTSITHSISPPKTRACTKTPGLSTIVFYSHSHSHTVQDLFYPICCFSILHINIIDSIRSLPLLHHSLRTLIHALIHESEETDRASANTHAVNKAAGEERAEDGAEVGVGDLWKKA